MAVEDPWTPPPINGTLVGSTAILFASLAMQRFQQISVQQTRQLLAEQDITLVDIRDGHSYQEGHIEGALLLDNSSIESFLASTDREKPVVVYCYHGISSQGAANYLLQQGFTTVYSMDGGYEGWRSAAT